MTPDAVIFKYLKALAEPVIDVDGLCALILADAGLLQRWLQMLGLPADRQQLMVRMHSLPAEDLRNLASVQAWGFAEQGEHVHLSMERWQNLLRYAYLGVELHQHIAGSTDENFGLRLLMALSGVHLDDDPQLADLNEYRGVAPALLEGAALELRVAAVVGAVETGRAQALAASLLDLPGSEFHALSQFAENKAQGTVFALGLNDGDVDWQHQIWLLQRVSQAGLAMRSCQSIEQLVRLHRQASRALFRMPPWLMFEDLESRQISTVIAPQYSIPLNSVVSEIAACAREHAARHIADSSESAVVDRQLLRAMGVEEAFVACNRASPRTLMLISADEELDVSAAAEMYLAELDKHVARLSGSAPDAAANQGLIAFREAEIERLREVVHEANNPLSIVHNYLHILELRLQHDVDAADQIRLISSELQRAATIFAGARDIPDEVKVETILDAGEIHLHAWLADQVTLLSGLASTRDVMLRLQADGVDRQLRLDPMRMNQIITNLLKNAIEACSAGDEVVLGCSSNVFRGTTSGVEIYVQDSGPGLDMQVMATLAESKRTTKAGDHQGLGLKVVYELAAQLGLNIDLRTGDNGTRFSVFVPH